MADEMTKPQVRGFIERSIPGRQIGDGDDIFASGFINSLFAMQLVAFVEKTFGIEIDSDDLELDNFRSIDAISALVERKLAPATA